MTTSGGTAEPPAPGEPEGPSDPKPAPSRETPTRGGMVTNSTTYPTRTEQTYGPCRLPADASAPGAARHWVAHLDDPRTRHQHLGLVVSELVTNVVVHTTCPEVVVAVTVGDGPTLLEVSDCDSSPPRLREGQVQGRPAGMGLRVVDAVSDGWGVESRGVGKTVWARFVVG